MDEDSLDNSVLSGMVEVIYPTNLISNQVVVFVPNIETMNLVFGICVLIHTRPNGEPEWVFAHELDPPGPGSAISRIRNNRSQLLALNQYGLSVFYNRFNTLVQDQNFESTKRKQGETTSKPTQRGYVSLSSATPLYDEAPSGSAYTTAASNEGIQRIYIPTSSSTAASHGEIRGPTGYTMTDIEKLQKKERSLIPFQNLFLQDRQLLQILIPHKDLTEQDNFNKIQFLIKGDAAQLNCMKSFAALKPVLQMNFMKIQLEGSYEAADTKGYFTFADLRRADDSSSSVLVSHGRKDWASFDTLRSIATNLKMFFSSIMSACQAKRDETTTPSADATDLAAFYREVFTPWTQMLVSEEPNTSLLSSNSEDVFEYMQDTFQEFCHYLRNPLTETKQKATVQQEILALFKPNPTEMYARSQIAEGIRRHKAKKAADPPMPSIRPKRQRKSSPRQLSPASRSPTSKEEGKEDTKQTLCAAHCTFLIRGKDASSCRHGDNCKYKHADTLRLLKMGFGKTKVLEALRSLAESTFRDETIKLVKKWTLFQKNAPFK
jgi:hypothetical protein